MVEFRYIKHNLFKVFPNFFGLKLPFLLMVFFLVPTLAKAGSFSTISGLDGGTYKSGFATIEAASEWGWINSLPHSLASQYSLSYGGYMYYKTYSDKVSPPADGHTDYWWRVNTPTGGYPNYAIDWVSGDFPISKDFGINSCNASPSALLEGNAIQFSRGNNFQTDYDSAFGLESPSFVRTYNSNYTVGSGPLGEKWHHNYESQIIKYPDSSIGLATVQRPNGKSYIYILNNGIWSGDADVKDVLTTLTDQRGVFSGWQILSEGGLRTERYNTSGKLVAVKYPNGQMTTLDYNSSQQLISVVDSFGRHLSLNYDGDGRIATATLSSGSVNKYAYDSSNRLISVTRSDSKSRQYFYEQTNAPFALTGIVDERGIRSATWAYDDQVRVVSSKQGKDAGSELITYSDDGSTTVTNTLGKKTNYQYQTILGVKYIASVKGEPSANCPISNSSFTYDDRGQMLTKTDAKGLVTAYTYNDRGLETSRTEASGTPLARTVTTEWDPDRFLPTKVVEPTRVTAYSYDNQGRELTRQVTSR
jgi:YD repeat-containing protein